MQFLLLAVCLAAGCQASVLHDWNHFKMTHQKTYKDSAEEIHRLQIFQTNKKWIEEHNKKFNEGLVSYEMGINKFADLSEDEFSELMGGMIYSRDGEQPESILHRSRSDSSGASSHVDWRESGAVTPIKDQGRCGSCWAFSAAGALESHHYIKSGELVALSEQNLIDCTYGPPYGNEGCGGGYMNTSYQYVTNNGGIDTEASYPYRGKEGWCMFRRDRVGTTAAGYKEILAGDEEALRDAVQRKGPVSVAIFAAARSFMLYKGGVYSEPRCGKPNHAVLVIGYGVEKGIEYWLGKNSWSTAWGDRGYFKIRRNYNNHCGIASYASYPIV